MYGVLRCAHISLFGSHNNPISRQGKDRSRITYVFTDEETEFRKVKLFSHVIWAVSPAQSFVVFLPYQTMSVSYVFKQITCLFILSRNLNQIPAIDCEGLSWAPYSNQAVQVTISFWRIKMHK